MEMRCRGATAPLRCFCFVLYRIQVVFVQFCFVVRGEDAPGLKRESHNTHTNRFPKASPATVSTSRSGGYPEAVKSEKWYSVSRLKCTPYIFALCLCLHIYALIFCLSESTNSARKDK